VRQRVKRNAERFPEDFIFQLTAGEFSAFKVAGKVSGDGRAALRSQIVILESGRHAKYPPFVFVRVAGSGLWKFAFFAPDNPRPVS